MCLFHCSIVIFSLCRREGVAGFYKGITANLAKVVPAVSITFLVYEYTSAALMTDR